MATDFAHLHLHTDYSMLDGLGKPPAYAQCAHELGFKYIAITDHGTLSGTWEFYMACKALGINPILGCEFYFVPYFSKVKDKKSKEDGDENTAKRYHVTILARNEAGFRTLAELITAANGQFYYKPLIDWPMLEALGDAAENLVCLSGCAGSRISRLLVGGSRERPEIDAEHLSAGIKETRRWQKVFPHFYIETMMHKTAIDIPLNDQLLAVGRKLHIPHVITNDAHYVHKEDHKHHDALLAIQTASDIDDPTRFRFDGRGYHLRSRQELRKAYQGYDERVFRDGIRNTMRVAKLCDISISAWDNKRWHIPKFPLLPPDTTADKYLRKLVKRGLRDRGLAESSAYVERAEFELKEIKRTGVANFLLITWEAINWATKRGIRVGPGRGSICGCLVAYLIGIHKMDSIRYKLMFERFLNPERPKAPDVDSDFEPVRRHEVFEHYSDLYGEENVKRVAAFQTLKIAAVFQSLARAHGMGPQERNRWSKELGSFDKRDEEEDRDEDYEDESVLPEEIRDNYPGMVDQMKHLLGTKRAISRHAAGVLIFDPLDDIISTVGSMWLPKKDAPGGGNWAAMFDLKTVEGMNLMKQDTLGLRTLSTIEECVRMVKQNHGVELDVDSWVPDEEPDDDKVYEMLAKGDVAGVFQMEGGSNAKGIMEIAPTGFEDIVACTALYRKGPIMAGAPNRFLKNKRDNKVRVAHKSLMPILGDTWGEMIYDEQMFELLRLAGFSWARVDDGKNAMKKKDPALMAPLKEEAIAGWQKHAGMSVKEAKKLWKTIEAQTAYLFNRSHAVAYTFTTYVTARLKYLYPLEFLTALIRTVKADSTHLKKRMGFIGQMVERGYAIRPPEINTSDARATSGYRKDGRGWFQFGFTDCKGIGDSSAAKIIALREEGTYGFFCPEDVKVATNVFAILKGAGAFRRIGGTKSKVGIKHEILGWRFSDPMKAWRDKWASRVVFPTEDKKTVILVGELVDIEHRKTKNNDPFVVWTIQWAPGRTFRVTLWQDADDVWGTKRGSIVKISGKWQMTWSNLAVSNSDEQVMILEAA